MNYKELIEKSESDLFIIAEAGVNHNGDLQTAFDLVDAAVMAGCDAVKFQTWITEKVYSKEQSLKPDYQKRATDINESEFDTVKKLELSFDQFRQIKAYCEEKGIMFFSTPDELGSACFLKELGVDLYKTASQDVTNTPFLAKLAEFGLPIIFSTGASTISELALGVEAMAKTNNQLIILHCVSSYPAPEEDMNLRVISSLKDMFGYPIGFSDHTKGVEVACAAVAMGARIFEKHLTLDKDMGGPDHQASLNPEEMKHYCVALKNAYKALGDGVKRIMPCEENVRQAFRRFLVAARELNVGDTIREEDLIFKKVVDGIEPKYIDLVVGSAVTCRIEEDKVIDWSMIKKT
ncbi:MAG: N-acetylneuraminate synthase family protein [Methylocystaceae bacterium]|nr:N-acetylneuraminate synthase family protein [Methylocystaceae bacterium]